jgi:hypothetical protein
MCYSAVQKINHTHVQKNARFAERQRQKTTIKKAINICIQRPSENLNNIMEKRRKNIVETTAEYCNSPKSLADVPYKHACLQKRGVAIITFISIESQMYPDHCIHLQAFFVIFYSIILLANSSEVSSLNILEKFSALIIEEDDTSPSEIQPEQPNKK